MVLAWMSGAFGESEQEYSSWRVVPATTSQSTVFASSILAPYVFKTVVWT